MVKISSSFL